MDVVIVVGYYALVGLVAWRLRELNLALGACPDRTVGVRAVRAGNVRTAGWRTHGPWPGFHRGCPRYRSAAPGVDIRRRPGGALMRGRWPDWPSAPLGLSISWISAGGNIGCRATWLCGPRTTPRRRAGTGLPGCLDAEPKRSRAAARAPQGTAGCVHRRLVRGGCWPEPQGRA